MLVVVGVEKIDSTQHQVTYFAWLLIVIYPYILPRCLVNKQMDHIIITAISGGDNFQVFRQSDNL